ncbi:polysaccharide deacetylase family protein [Halalkalibacter akibai]|uniref:Polysaccharide deacetylase n=1 Tax=Halalkalibacter akibai (strain ATCC 43226 / DSM 21942 / CIP 109018 / JCM 9157 / 1139) TaxID=1236973 RepID=W4QTM2_HALA3|nr:polysaccharide deacetylase family protein [Halalkalibacter akibai]GAE35510.1 polysaccharide deacetylase [Halalkalibacter akibai JCM 9157]
MRHFFVKASVVVILLLVVGYVLFEISGSRTFQFWGGLVGKVETQEKVVALTFDDGPTEKTEEILAILRDEGVKGTFYLTGKELETNFEDAVQIVEEGHEIGNHSYSHQRMVLKSSTFIKEELERTDELIRQTGYEGDIHFRPPYGKRLFLLPYFLNKEERKTILWNIEPETYPEVANDANKIVEHVIEKIEPGSIILLHVMYESRTESMNSIRGIIASLQEQGYIFVTVSELLEFEVN